MSTGVYFRKNCEAMPLLIRTNINFIFHRNAAIDIVGIITADTDVLYHRNLFLEIYIAWRRTKFVHFQHSCHVMKAVINYLHEFCFFHQMLQLLESDHYPELFPHVHIYIFAISILFKNHVFTAGTSHTILLQNWFQSLFL